TQTVSPGKYTLWDHSFELPRDHLAATVVPPNQLAVGQVAHRLLGVGNADLEVFDYPGGYARRFDGVAPGGGDRHADLDKVFQENRLTTDIRMQEEMARSLTLRGAGTCGQFLPGHLFQLRRHHDADGRYLLTRVEHEVRLGGNYRSGEDMTLDYKN